ncbi:hypothetical protein CBL_03832 [Carabus blaptoides fortunei]
MCSKQIKLQNHTMKIDVAFCASNIAHARDDLRCECDSQLDANGARVNLKSWVTVRGQQALYHPLVAQSTSSTVSLCDHISQAQRKWPGGGSIMVTRCGRRRHVVRDLFYGNVSCSGLTCDLLPGWPRDDDRWLHPRVLTIGVQAETRFGPLLAALIKLSNVRFLCENGRSSQQASGISPLCDGGFCSVVSLTTFLGAEQLSDTPTQYRACCRRERIPVPCRTTILSPPSHPALHRYADIAASSVLSLSAAIIIGSCKSRNVLCEHSCHSREPWKLIPSIAPS